MVIKRRFQRKSQFALIKSTGELRWSKRGCLRSSKCCGRLGLLAAHCCTSLHLTAPPCTSLHLPAHLCTSLPARTGWEGPAAARGSPARRQLQGAGVGEDGGEDGGEAASSEVLGASRPLDAGGCEPRARGAAAGRRVEVALRRGVGKRNLPVHTPARLRAQL